MRRTERRCADHEKQTLRTLFELDYLLLVDDQTRADFCYSQLLRPILRRSLGTRGVRLDSFVLGITYFLEIAFDTFRIARLTNAPSVPDQLMGEENPLVAWNRGHQIQLNLLRLSVLG